MSTVVLVGSLDTKGDEYRFARDRLRALKIDTIVVDTGVLGDPGFAADITAAQVAAAGGASLGRLRKTRDRAAALDTMAQGVSALLGRLRAERKLDGVFALGGSGNTTVAATAFRTLPVGVPKLILSTMTAGDIRTFVAGSDLVMAASVVDIAGLNRISRVVIANAAAALAGMVLAAPLVGKDDDRPLVAASMIGLTTRAVTAARRRLEKLGYEVLVFHMTGAGGSAMEAIIDQGLVAGVLDLTTSELANELCGGVCSAGPGRLRSAARRGVPQVVAPGGLDMINFRRPDSVPPRYADRRLHAHNSEVTLVRTSPAESAELGRRLVERVTGQTERVSGQAPQARDGTAPRPIILLPSGGLSAIDTDGHPFHDAEADAALIAAVQSTASPDDLRVIDVAGNIDRCEVGSLAADLLHDLIVARSGGQECTQ